MLGPFSLHGFAFLVFYLAAGGVALLGQFFWTRRGELAGLAAQPSMTDPYLIAYLRGGADQALNIAAVALIDRGLLKGGLAMLTAEPDAEGLARRPIEKAILRLYRISGSASDMATDAKCLDACREYQEVLELRELVAGPKIYGRRLIPMLVAVGFIVFVGVVKLLIALSEGRSFGLLFLLMIALGVASVAIFRRRLTARGKAMLDDLEIIFARLRDRAATLREGGATNEAALLAAVYGLDELPPERFPGTKPLRRKKQDSACGGGSGCGGGCGGGGSCGGGCGGGCGG
jgi:uncharacterized protein (TIGR04222 family)